MPGKASVSVLHLLDTMGWRCAAALISLKALRTMK